MGDGGDFLLGDGCECDAFLVHFEGGVQDVYAVVGDALEVADEFEVLCGGDAFFVADFGAAKFDEIASYDVFEVVGLFFFFADGFGGGIGVSFVVA